MLYLVGIGLTKGDLSLKAIEECKKCDLFVDRYTSFVDDDRLEFLTEMFEKPIKILDRAALEERLPELLKIAKEKDIAIFVGGDPLVATTHKITFIEAKKANVQVKVIHSVSAIVAMMGECGLDFYRFGQICTISKWVKHYSPTSFYETIQRNLKNDLHSIVLLDFDAAKGSSLELKEAIGIIEEAEKQYKGKIFDDNTIIFVMHKVTLEDSQKMLTTVKQAKKLTFANGPTTIIIPAKLSDVEKEVLGAIY